MVRCEYLEDGAAVETFFPLFFYDYNNQIYNFLILYYETITLYRIYFPLRLP